MSVLIVIPARYGSTRLPGKPLRDIAGVPMLLRTAQNAHLAISRLKDADLEADSVIATDDERIEAFCRDHDLTAVMTARNIKTGSDRALVASNAIDPDHSRFDVILNLQGDAPFTPPDHMVAVVQALMQSDADAATAYVQLDWAALDALREHKKTTPFSGTTLIEDRNNRALWFSKTLIPALRDEAQLRDMSDLSPIKRHIGLYAYRRATLATFTAMEESPYERLEGLEQLRLIEAGYDMRCVAVSPPQISLGGIDTEADIALAEDLITAHGDPYKKASLP